MRIETHRAQPRASGPSCLLLACSLLVPRIGSAQTQPSDAASETHPEARQRVSALMRQGLEEFRRKNLEGARSAFAEAWAIEHHSAIAANLGDMELRLGRYRDAAEHWSYYLRNAPPERDRSDARSAIAECRKHVASLTISAVSGVEVVVDGHVVGTTPIDQELWMDPGTHSVAGRFQDRTTANQEISLVAGDARQLALAAPAPSVSSPPPLPVATTPTPAAKPRESSGTSLRAPVLVAGSVFTAIAAGAGIIFASKWQRESDAAESQKAKINAAIVQASHSQVADAGRACRPPDGQPAAGCDALAANVESARRAKTSTQVAFISAGVLGVGTLAALVLWPKSSSTDAQGVRVSPWSDASGAGLSAFGTF